MAQPLPPEVVEALVTRLDGETLRQLAALADARRHPAVRLDAAGMEKMVGILVAGDRPTIGFYRRHAEKPVAKRRTLADAVADARAAGLIPEAGAER